MTSEGLSETIGGRKHSLNNKRGGKTGEEKSRWVSTNRGS